MQDINAQVAQLEAQLHQQQADIAKREADLAQLEAELIAFKGEYDHLVTPAVVKLDAARAAVAELERQRFARTLADEREDGYSAWTPPPNYVSVEEQFRRKWGAPANPPPQRDVNAPHVGDLPPRPKGDPDPRSKQAQLKALYRQLVRRYHPDLAHDADKTARNQLMVLINDAYAQHDLDALRVVAEMPNRAGDVITIDLTEPLAALKLRTLQAAVADATARLAALEREHSDLIHSDLMDLKIETSLAAAQGRDRLREIADALDAEYWGVMAQLDALRSSD